MRGKLKLYFWLFGLMRITPAHAGKTTETRVLQISKKDHPRACGENYIIYGCVCYTEGSPPRMRGKQQVPIGQLPVARITPAHAGKTNRNSERRFKDRDHPRACGENVDTVKHIGYNVGSPPRMRGKRVGKINVLLIVRITPAHAGKTIKNP